MSAKLIKITAVLLLAGIFSSCKEKIDMSDIDFNNIDNLNEQPIPVIRKCIEGSWERHFFDDPDFYQGYDDPYFMHINRNHIILCDKNGDILVNTRYTLEKLTRLGAGYYIHGTVFTLVPGEIKDGILYTRVPIECCCPPCPNYSFWKKL